MSERKINLEEILQDYYLITLDNRKEIHAPIEDVKLVIIEFGEQLLELVTENAKIEIKTVGEELVITDIHQEDNYTRIQVNLESILNTIKQVE